MIFAKKHHKQFFILLCLVLLLAACGRPSQSGQAFAADPAGAGKEQATADRPGQKIIRFAAMGDIMLGNEGALPPDGGAGMLADVRPHLAGRDVVLGNLEGPLTDRGKPTKPIIEGRSYAFRTPPSYGKHLKDVGFTVVTLANNHVNDYGPEGRAQTVSVLESLGIKHTGAPGQIAVQEVNGQRVAVIGLAPNRGCQDINDIPGVVALVKEANKHPNTLVVVTFHGGAEGTGHMRVPDGLEMYLGEKRGELRKLSRAVIDAGADLVIGHGPHVPRGIEVYKNRLIAYSLGNFATGIGINVQGATGLAPLLLVDLSPSGELVNLEVVSFRQQRGMGPKKDASKEAAKVMASLSREMKLDEKWVNAILGK